MTKNVEKEATNTAPEPPFSPPKRGKFRDILFNRHSTH